MNIGFCSALFLVFLVLKLTNTIGWSWVWITSPLWIDFILSVWASVVNTRREQKEKQQKEADRKAGKKTKFQELVEQRMKERQADKLDN